MKQWLNRIVTALAACLALLGCIIQVNSLLRGHWWALSALALDAILLSLFIIRKPAEESVTGLSEWLFALCGTFFPFLLQPHPTAFAPILLLGRGLFPAAVIVTFFAIQSLGRGFGIIAARREIKTHGAYRYMRHPLYAGEGLWFLSLVLQNLSWFNACLFVVQTACQIHRMKTEEALLSKDPDYALYLETVKYRLIPGIF